MLDIPRIYIGWDPREQEAYDVCRHSIQKHASGANSIHQLKQSVLRRQGIYKRTHTAHDGVMYDDSDGKPFSTEFAFSRFLVPYLTGYNGWAIFMDCDMMIKRDIYDLWNLRDDNFDVMVVKHVHYPKETVKMDGQIQVPYQRKNWSSVMLMNCARLDHLTPNVVNTASGRWLHSMSWVDDPKIGGLPKEWNWLEGYSDPKLVPANVHFTRGGPWFEDYRNVAYADEWRALAAETS